MTDQVTGYLEIGVEGREVVVVHRGVIVDKDGVGWMKFSKKQAHEFAGVVKVNADRIPDEVPQPHGWVTPIAGGARARCGGPGMCPDCKREAAEKMTGIAVELQKELDTVEKTRAAEQLAQSRKYPPNKAGPSLAKESRLSLHAQELLRASNDSLFECGEHDSSEADEPYDDVFERHDAHYVALVDYIVMLEVAVLSRNNMVAPTA